ncbi:MAG: rod shape-determining protein MreD [Chloroflexi bacterium]|nr:rod shape-determining protein MreD [Chloroflexota bacterium]
MIATILVVLPFAIGVVALQVTVIDQLRFLGGHPDLLLVTLVVWTALAGRGTALLPLLFMAPLYDALAGLPLGASVLPLLLVVYLAGLSERALFGSQLGWPVIISFVATILSSFILFMELILLGWNLTWSAAFLNVVLPSAFLNSIVTLLFYLPLATWRQRRSEFF